MVEETLQSDTSSASPAMAGEGCSSPASARVKWCEGCAQVLPLDRFYVTKKKVPDPVTGIVKTTKSRFKICKECRRKQALSQRKAKRKELSDNLQAILARAANSKTIDVAHISEVAAALTAKLGGVDATAEHWAANIQLANEIAPGKRDTIKNYEAWANLILKSTENRQTAPDVTGMTTEDIERELRKLVLEQGDNLERLSGAN